MRLSDKNKLNEYQEFLCDGEIRLTSRGINKLLDDTISEAVENELGLTYRGNGTWATDYCDHKRKVLHLFRINPSYATFRWGWCFDFIPIKKGKKLVYLRTDKQLDSHIFEVSDDFRNNTENRKKTTICARETATGEMESALKTMQKKYMDTFLFLLPSIKAYFDSTNSYQEIIKNIDDKITAPNVYYCAVNPMLKIVKVYLAAFLGEKEVALGALEKLSFPDEGIREKHLENLRMLSCPERVIPYPPDLDMELP